MWVNPKREPAASFRDDPHRLSGHVPVAHCEGDAELNSLWTPAGGMRSSSPLSSDQLQVPPRPPTRGTDGILGVLKTRISASGVCSFLWEGRWRDFLVGIGLRAHFESSPQIRVHSNVGAEFMYIGA